MFSRKDRRAGVKMRILLLSALYLPQTYLTTFTSCLQHPHARIHCCEKMLPWSDVLYYTHVIGLPQLILWQILPLSCWTKRNLNFFLCDDEKEQFFIISASPFIVGGIFRLLVYRFEYKAADLCRCIQVIRIMRQFYRVSNFKISLGFSLRKSIFARKEVQRNNGCSQLILLLSIFCYIKQK